MSNYPYYDEVAGNQQLEYVDADDGLSAARIEDDNHTDYVDTEDNYEANHQGSDRDRSPSPISGATFNPIVSNKANQDDTSGISGTMDTRERSIRSLRRDRDHYRNSSNREYSTQLVNEGRGTRQMRKVLIAAFDRLDAETRRAQEAERRALDIAQRFKIVNDARIAAQQEANRVKEELHLYKLQLSNAQSEIARSSELLRDIEAQRDDAEAAAARARSTARRLKEQHLMTLAVEEGRRQGYQEGVKRGYEEARSGRYREGGVGSNALAVLVADDAYYGTAPPPSGAVLDDLPDISLDLPSPPRGEIPLTAPTQVADAGHPASAVPLAAPGAGAEGSRFRENIASPVPSTLDSLSLAASGRPIWPLPPPGETPKHIRAPKLPSTSISHSPSRRYTTLHDGYVPSAGADNYIRMPPPHEVEPHPPSNFRPSSVVQSTIPSIDSERDDISRIPNSEPRVRDYAYTQKPLSSPRSVAESLPSTTMSQYDLLSSPHQTAARRVLSSIPEVSTSMEMSPSAESRTRSSVMPEPVVFPTAAQGSGAPTAVAGDSFRYSDASVLDEWRRTTADELNRSNSRSSRGSSRQPAADTIAATPLHRSSSAGGTRTYYSETDASSLHQRSRSDRPRSDTGSFVQLEKGHLSKQSPGGVTITVQPPSGTSSEISPGAANSTMLSPNSANNVLPPVRPIVPTVLDASGMPSVSSAAIQAATVHNFPPGVVPTSFGSSDPYQSAVPFSLQTSPQIPKHGIYSGLNTDLRNASTSSDDLLAGSHRSRPPRTRLDSLTSSEALRSKTSVGHPPSASGDIPTPSSRSHTPMQYIPAPAPSNRSHTPSQLQYVPAPTPPRVQYIDISTAHQNARSSTPGNAGADVPIPSSAYRSMSPRSSTSRLSDRQRSHSLNAGVTPAAPVRPLSSEPPPQLHRVPSTGSISSAVSGRSDYKRYDRRDYADPAYLASTDDLHSYNAQNDT